MTVTASCSANPFTADLSPRQCGRPSAHLQRELAPADAWNDRNLRFGRTLAGLQQEERDPRDRDDAADRQADVGDCRLLLRGRQLVVGRVNLLRVAGWRALELALAI